MVVIHFMVPGYVLAYNSDNSYFNSLFQKVTAYFLLVILILWSGTGHLLSVYLINLHKSGFRTWISNNIENLQPVEISKTAIGLEIIEEKNGQIKEIKLNNQMYDVVLVNQDYNSSNIFICIPDYKEQKLKLLFTDLCSKQDTLPVSHLLLKWKKTTYTIFSHILFFFVDKSNNFITFCNNNLSVVYLTSDIPPPETVVLHS